MDAESEGEESGGSKDVWIVVVEDGSKIGTISLGPVEALFEGAGVSIAAADDGKAFAEEAPRIAIAGVSISL
jgi:hypothetical protein